MAFLAFVFYNRNALQRPDNTLRSGDILELAGKQEFDKPTLSDRQVCEAVFAGCNANSDKEFPWFLAYRTIRSMALGDVVTIVRGAGGTKISYTLATQGWERLPVIVRQSGTYKVPEGVPVLWIDNERFVTAADELSGVISGAIQSANLLIARSEDIKALESETAKMREMGENLLSYISNDTPETLSLMVRTISKGISVATLCDTIGAYLSILGAVQRTVNRVADFTRMRLSQSTRCPQVA